MEFSEKLQELRKLKGLTQEELAASLYVSRTAVSKWESGRGYPNIDSLKAIAKEFSVSLDELLSSEEALTIAEEDNKRSVDGIIDVIFGLMDIGALLLIFLPFFAQRVSEEVQEVSLLRLTEIAPYMRAVYFSIIIVSAAWGILRLALQNCQHRFWTLVKLKVSLALSACGTVAFTLGLQPYAAVFMLLFLIIKVFLILKK